MPGKKLSAGLLSVLAVTLRLLKVLTLLWWKKDVQIDESSPFQGDRACPTVEARARGDSGASQAAVGKAGVMGTC